jgi:NADH-quinone oxidoreductase subunit L
MNATSLSNLLACVSIFSPLCVGAIYLTLGHCLQSRSIARLAVVGLLCSFIASCCFLQQQLPVAQAWYTWLSLPDLTISLTYCIGKQQALLLSIISIVSLVVHIYSIEYMQHEAGYARYFAYLGFFTSAMLLFVVADNWWLLFFAWEALGLASYWLIGFWYERPLAGRAALKALLINRLGDMGLLLAILAMSVTLGSSNINVCLNQVQQLAPSLQLLIASSFLLPIMSKSAQVPLHVWLPDSMQGPTPVSALLHAATMVTAGVLLLCKLQPLYQAVYVFAWQINALILWIGAVTSAIAAFLAIGQHDLKKIVAYSTVSQLGYMIAALGAGAPEASLFHVYTHAFFKALLFLAAGMIIKLSHAQDLPSLGRLSFKSAPWTSTAILCATLAMVGVPGFSGFYSKDILLEAIAQSIVPGHMLAHQLLSLTIVATAWYSFRLLYILFLAKEKPALAGEQHYPKVCFALFTLIVPSCTFGALYLFYVAGSWQMLWQLICHSWQHAPLWMMLLGAAGAYLQYRYTNWARYKLTDPLNWLFELTWPALQYIATVCKQRLEASWDALLTQVLVAKVRTLRWGLQRLQLASVYAVVAAMWLGVFGGFLWLISR